MTRYRVIVLGMTTKASTTQAAFIDAILKRKDGYRAPGSKVFGKNDTYARRIKNATITSCIRRGWVRREVDENGRVFWSVTTEGRIAVGLSPVGPNGSGGWVHTDGQTYLHNPATSTYKRYDEMVPGDIIDWTGRATVEVIRVNEPYVEKVGPLAGRECRAHWCRRLDSGREGYVPFGPDGAAPVRHAQTVTA